MDHVNQVRALIGSCSLLILAACGGGGSSGGSTGNSYPTGSANGASSSASVTSTSSASSSSSVSISSSSSSQSSGVSGSSMSSSVSSSSSSPQSSSSSSSSSIAGLSGKPRYLIATGTDPLAGSSAGIDLFLYASNSLVTPTFIKYPGVVKSWGTIGGRFVYFHVEPSQKIRLYGMRIDDVTITPVPYRISTLELSSADLICGVQYFLDDTNDDTTAKMIVRLAGINQTCGDNDDENKIISLNEVSLSDPQATVFQSDLNSFYEPLNDESGKLVGILFDDKSTSTLTIAKEPDLSQLVPLIPHDSSFYNYTIFYPNWQYNPFFTVVPNVGVNTLYRASISGDSKALYSAKGIFSIGTSDSSNIYFSDYYSNSFDIYKVPSTTTGQPTLLFSEQANYDNRRALLSSTGSKLILFRYDSTANMSRFQSIPVNSSSTTTTDFKTYSGMIIDRFTYYQPGQDPSLQKIIVTRWDSTAQSPGYVTDIFDTNGVLTLPSMNKVLVKRVLDWVPKLIAYNGMTDTNGNYSNSTFNDFDITTGAMISYKNPDGSVFKVGDGQVIMFDSGGLEYGVAHMGYPDPNNPKFYLDSSKPSVVLIFDFVSRVIYPMPSSTSGETLFY